MHIIIIGTAYPFRGGLAAFNERLAREYQSQGHQVEVMTFTLQYPGFLFPGKTQFSSEPYPNDLKITREFSSVNPVSWIKTGKKIKKAAPDKVIFCYWMSFMAPCFSTIARYAANPKTKMIGLIHNMIPHEPSVLDRIFPRFFVNAMDGFVAMADSVVADIHKFDKHDKKKCVSPHPIYDHYGEKIDRKLASMQLGLDPESRYVLFFGFIRHYKGLDLLLEAFSDERLRQFPLKLIVAGEFYESPDYYMKLMQINKIGNFVELRTRFIDDAEVKNYFSIADIVAQPYRSATQSGVSQIAYHFETPMLVTDVGGLAETVPHNKVGYVVNVSPKDIADALFDFFTNNRAAEFTNNIKEEKKRFAWSRMTEAINNLNVCKTE